MSIGPINDLSSGYLPGVLSSTLQNTGATLNRDSHSASGLDGASSAPQPDNGELSPFAQTMSKLQYLQKSDPIRYQQLTHRIAKGLQSAAQIAQSNGNSRAAIQLNQLAADFSAASKSIQLPNLEDLAQAIRGDHRQPHSYAAAAGGDSSSTALNGGVASKPLSIINDTLSKARI
jgi:hypothetical protein